jgi:hypothetical protein
MMLTHAVLISLPIMPEVERALVGYMDILVVAVFLGLVAWGVGKIVDHIKHLRHRYYVIRRLMEGDGAKR